MSAGDALCSMQCAHSKSYRICRWHVSMMTKWGEMNVNFQKYSRSGRENRLNSIFRCAPCDRGEIKLDSHLRRCSRAHLIINTHRKKREYICPIAPPFRSLLAPAAHCFFTFRPVPSSCTAAATAALLRDDCVIIFKNELKETRITRKIAYRFAYAEMQTHGAFRSKRHRKNKHRKYSSACTMRTL